jgi:mRNA-degrading endonuclease RelE of RelBE toxin-antitoxin system
MSDNGQKEEMTIAFTPQVKQYLQDLADKNPEKYGKKARTAAERLLVEQIEKLIKEGTLDERSR